MAAEQGPYEDYSEGDESEVDGLDFTWDVFPATTKDCKSMVIPPAALYTPLNNLSIIEQDRVQYQPLRCKIPKCNAVLNGYCKLEYPSNQWVCCMCGTRNGFPPNCNPRDMKETQAEFTTLEYMVDEGQIVKIADKEFEQPMYPPAFIFVIDTSMKVSELNALCSAIEQKLTTFPEEIQQTVLVGFITFGKHASLHEIGFAKCSKVHVFRGDSLEEKQHVTVDQIKAQLNVSGENMSRFLMPISELEEKGIISDLLGSINKDVWPKKSGCRQELCTGTAASVAVALLESCCQGQSGRILVFSGGPPSVGPGRVIDLDRKVMMRSREDIQKYKAKYHESAKKVYKQLGQRAVGNCHVIDLFACSLDQTGVAEQRAMVESSGGCIILNDTFTTFGFTESFNKIFELNAYNELSMCFDAEITVITCNAIKVKGCVGPVTSMGQKHLSVSDAEVGIGGTNKWSVGGLDTNTTLCFVFEVKNEKAVQNNTGCIQFVTSYRDSAGFIVERVTTCCVLYDTVNSRTKELKRSFNANVAAAVLGRISIYSHENLYDYQLAPTLDRTLVKFMSLMAHYTLNNPDSFQLSEEVKTFPKLIYYLRRCQLVREFGYSPDETAFYRFWFLRAPLRHCIPIMKPEMIKFSPDFSPTRVELEDSERDEECILVLDTFFHCVKWTGKTVADWREEKLREQKEWEQLGLFQDEAEEEMSKRCEHRFPYPIEIRCDQETSQERFLLAKLNVQRKQARRRRDSSAPGQIFTEDVSFEVFMMHLRKLATSQPQ